MAHLTPQETKLITDTQEDLAAVKDALEKIAVRMKRLAKMARDAGECEFSNVAMMLEGDVTEIRGRAIKAHAVASTGLLHCKEDGDIIVQGGGGGR